jgi:hypothetical protein
MPVPRDERPVHFAGRALTVGHLLEIIDIMRMWLSELDTTQKYSQPNGHVWNAVDNAQVKHNG